MSALQQHNNIILIGCSVVAFAYFEAVIISYFANVLFNVSIEIGNSSISSHHVKASQRILAMTLWKWQKRVRKIFVAVSQSSDLVFGHFT